jgi:hypothetical protein
LSFPKKVWFDSDFRYNGKKDEILKKIIENFEMGVALKHHCG